MEYAIEVLEGELRGCKCIAESTLTTQQYKKVWEERIKQLEAAIEKLKTDDTATKVYIERLENACCDCSEFEEFGYHDENCFVKKLKGE